MKKVLLPLFSLIMKLTLGLTINELNNGESGDNLTGVYIDLFKNGVF